MPPTVWQSRTTGLQYPVTPDSEIPDDDFGTPSTRPAITTKPSTSDTGPRYAPVMSLTGTAALASVLAAPVEADGKRYLRKASITGGITFDAASHTNIVFEDCVLDRGMGTYGVRAFWGTFTLPSSNWPEFRYCKIMNASSAKQLGLETTGHASRGLAGAPGVSTTNLTLEAGTRSQAELMADAGQGLLITSMFGPSLNGNTGDWSVGCAGFWFENGELAYPVAEITVAGNLIDIYGRLIPGSDLEFRGSANSPSLLVDGLAIAGR